MNDWITETTDKGHEENWGGIHTSGFCRACANVYTALNHIATDHDNALEEIDRLKVPVQRLDERIAEVAQSLEGGYLGSNEQRGVRTLTRIREAINLYQRERQKR